jgi:hypothetical protein
MEPVMSEEVERTLGRIESTMDHFGASLEEVKGLVRGSAESASDLRIEVTKGVTSLQERHASHESETARRFRVVDKRFDSTNRKLEDSNDAFAAHEKLEVAGDAHGMGGPAGSTVVAGGAAGAGAVGIWAIVQRVIEFFGATPPPAGH